MTADTHHVDVDVVVVGSLNLDLVVRVDRMPGPGETVSGADYAEYPGGKGLNQAVAAARAGASVAMVGAVGDDAAGASLRDVLEREGIDHQHVATVDAPTGRAAITVDATGENSIVVVAGANGRVRVGDIPHSSVVLAQLETPTDAVLAAFDRAKQRGTRTVLNPAPVRPGLDDVLSLTDLVVPNEHEFQLLGLDTSAHDHEVIRTEGARGVTWIGRSGSMRHHPAHAVEAIDTTGAGDSFCGHLVAALADGHELDHAIERANAAGALATGVRGAVPSIPTDAAVSELLTRDHGRP